MAYFPDSGLFSLVSEMTTGHHVGIAAVGAEGAIGLSVLLGMHQFPHSVVTLVPSRGYLIPACRLLEMFRDSENIRRVALAYIGSRMSELTVAAACNRVHSHRQRLARWLLMATQKAQQRSLPLTHEALAHIVGVPRHAVTIALTQLRRNGAIGYRRGRIDVLRRSALVAEACECYGACADLVVP
jgi:CRP-like cAMP-binding protein